MIFDLADIKHKTQIKLNELAGHDLKKYMEHAHHSVLEVEKKYGIRFKYGRPLKEH